jgi:DNA primase
MGILDEDVAAVRAASDIVGIVTQYQPLRRVGRRWTGLCPFHAERTASFSVNAEEGLYYCLSGDTRVLTWDGVKPIRELAGTTARILTERGRWVDAPFLSFGVQPLMRVTLTRNGQRKVIHATPEHRWLLRGTRGSRYERTTAELRKGHRPSWSFPQNRLRALGGLSPFGIAHGIAFGDGTRFGGGVCVDLHGEKDAQLLKWFPLNRVLTCREPKGDGWFPKVLDLPRSFKELPSLDESPSYLAGWLAGYLAAAGHVDAEGTCSISSATRANLEFVRDVCTRLGVGTYGVTTQVREGFAGREPSELHRVHLITEDLVEDFFLIDEHRRRFASSSKAWARRGWVVASVEATDRVEEVFCAVVEGTHNFTLEDNILTGNCFGCSARGDVITFVREVEHLDFVGAVEWLAAKAGMVLHYTDASEGEGRKKRNRLVAVMGRAVDWYHERLLSGPDARAARSYLRARGLDGDTVREYRIGWAPDAWDAACKALRLNEDDARDTGLGFRNSRDKLQDSFRARVMFPIFDAQGDPVSFGGRILPGNDDPRNHGKYKNTPETPLYHKSKVLYGLDRAKTAIVARDTAVVCEGYTDVIGFARSGVPLAVATCGTALTDDHVKLLRRYAKRLVLAFDADGAGQAAAERFYQWERDHDLEVAVADLPVGQDPGDLAQSDPPRLAAAVEGATPFLRFRLDRAFAAGDLTTPEGRAKVTEQALEIVAEHPVELVREQYLMDVGGRARMDADRLRPRLDELRRELQRRGPATAPAVSSGRARSGPGRDGGRGRADGRGGAGRPGATGGSGASGGSSPSGGPGGSAAHGGDEGAPWPDEAPWPSEADDGYGPGPGAGPGPDRGGRSSRAGDNGFAPAPKGVSAAGKNGYYAEGPALEVLRHAVHNSSEVVAWLRQELFDDPVHRGALTALAQMASIADAIADAEPWVADLLARLAVDEPQSEPFDAVRRLLTEVARAQLTVLRLGADTADDPAVVLADSAFLNRCVAELRTPQASVAAGERLLAWLGQRAGDGGID